MALVATLSERVCAPVPVTIPTHFRPSAATRSCDPLDPDEPADTPVLTTDRRLRRLAMLAADTGARFVREGLPHDPVAWLLAPRMLFSGRSAIDACQDREPFLRATLLHGLSLGLDADADELDALLSDDPDDGLGGDNDDYPDEADDETYEGDEASMRFDAPEMRLFSCIVEGPLGPGDRCVQAFCAMVAPDETWARRRLTTRYGTSLADAATVSEGFDCESTLAGMLLSEPMRRMLATVARNPACELGAGLDVQVEQRFAA
ncbi:hypothetical protein M9980_10785 [Sphingomonas donggukensis]|uniref:Uncharacterized protein n=1 Tax=Sphingomonas donggukensis TaxID=2949093 RepID=A0ABY4TUB7_9SPHN|nr:hypothetical protein [Sphingomonas donggukensis]URW75042.1 hypothetical protein M9980_10785 [Sphingomonas donggukensis]